MQISNIKNILLLMLH